MRRAVFPASADRLTGLLYAVALAGVGSGCGVSGPGRVAPSEIPTLEAHVAQNPNDGRALLRYAAALFAADRCDSAITVARRGAAQRPSDVVGPLVTGQCLERAGLYDGAILTYQQFLERYPNAAGADAVLGQETLARQAQATAVAREALAREAELTAEPASPQTVAVLPLVIAGDSSFQPLSRGLAQMITSDLALLGQFQLVERVELNALLEELELGRTGRVDAVTAARVGHLTRAGQMVQGLVAIPPQGQTRLEATVVQGTGEVSDGEVVDGRFRDLLRMEKQLVVGIAEQLGYRLSQAERQLIEENGTENLTAFLAYSRGLGAEDLGDFNAAALHFSQAVRADPGFQDAQTRRDASIGAGVMSGASAADVTAVGSTTDQAIAQADAPGVTLQNAVGSSLGDLAATQAELITQTVDETETVQQTTQQSTDTSTAEPQPTTTAAGIPPTVTGTVRIIFRLP